MLYYFIDLLYPNICLIWGAILALKWKSNSRPQNIFVGFLACFFFSCLQWSSYILGPDCGVYYKMDILEAFSIPLGFALLYFFFRSLTDERPLTWKDYLWLLPVVVIGGGTFLLYLLMGDKNATAYMCHMIAEGGKITQFDQPIYRWHYFLSVTVFNFVAIGEIIFIFIYAIVRYIKYRRNLHEFFSNMEGKSIKNIQAILISLFFFLIVLLMASKGRFYLNNYPVYLTLCTFLFGTSLFVLSYNVQQLQYTADKFSKDLDAADQEAEKLGYSLLPDNNENGSNKRNAFKQAELLGRFEELISTDKIFLQSNLRLDNVALMLRTNRTYISRLINEEYKTSFSDFINSKRIDYAKELMRSNPMLTQEQIAEQSGFTHASSFSRVFKEVSGITFKEWQTAN